MYLPHVGSWITSQTRAFLHRDLHNFRGVDCATDSFKTLKDIRVSKTIGGLKKEEARALFERTRGMVPVRFL